MDKMDLPKTYVKDFHDLDAVKKMKYNRFGNNNDMYVSALSLGTGGFSYFYGDYSMDECKRTVHVALKNGINYIDTAPWYGHGTSEEILGHCLKDVPRESYYIATKVGRYEKDPKKMFDFSAKKTRESIETSLKRLNIDYLDVIQVHDIEFAPSLDVVINETLPVLQEAVREGKAKLIGVTGYPVAVLEECVKRSNVNIDMILSYTRLTLIDQSLNDFLPFFLERGIGVVNASAFSMGLLTNDGPPKWHPAHQDIKDVCQEASSYCKFKNIELARLASYYAYNQNGPHTNLIGVNRVNLLKENLDVFHNGLNASETDCLNYLINNIFIKLTRRHWEGVELEKMKTGNIFK